jgi:hypothetical protein
VQSPSRPFFTFNGQYSRDFVNQKGQIALTAFVSGTFRTRGLPGSQTRFGPFDAQYYPYIGGEYFDKLGGSPASHLYLLTGRAYGELRLYRAASGLGRSGYQPFVLSCEYQYRYVAHGTAGGLPKQLHLLAIGPTLYLDEHSHFGVGLRYQKGRDRVDDFKYRERSVVTLKVLL